MRKWVKRIIALLLLPVCAGAVAALGRVLRASGHADTIWVAALAGAACWLVVYLLLPKPMLVYVFGHELTHALSTWLMGGKVKRFRASAKGGSVVVTRNNFVVALAPYFCPVYVLLVVLVFVVGDLLWNWRAFVVWFHLLLGAAYAFHVTLTGHILHQRQSDLAKHGYLFSGVIVFLGNMLVLVVGVPLLTARVGVLTALRWWVSGTGEVLQRLGAML
ncbi:MAG: M50 family metallopeptidase [Verrucomicrobiota bacterium]